MSEKVKRYYEKNSSKFKLFGVDPKGKNIHQPLWGKEVVSKNEAANYSNRLVLQQISDFIRANGKKISVLDLGCGFGSTLSFLLKHQQIKALVNYLGITISEYQAREAQRELRENAMIQCGDFQDLSTLYSNMDVIYAIESVVHSPKLEVLFDHLGKTLNSGGIFVIIDDFLEKKDTLASAQLINDYQDNWITPSLTDADIFVEIANKSGFHLKYSESLRPLIKQSFKGVLGRLVYKMGLRRSSNTYLKSIIGGAARQNALLKGVFDYRLMVFTKY